MKKRRRALSQTAQHDAAQAVLAHVTGFEPYLLAKSVMAYAACRGELSLEMMMADALMRGKTLLLPRCESPGVMTARRVTRMEELDMRQYGLMEPADSCEIAAPQEIDLIFVPGTAFDVSGGRIGQGGGYYDRFLAQTKALRVGVCHGFALLGSVPVQAHDARMDELITPEGIIRARKTSDDGRT